MAPHDRARELARTGRFDSPDAIVAALSREGYPTADAELGPLGAWELMRLCQDARARAWRPTSLGRAPIA